MHSWCKPSEKHQKTSGSVIMECSKSHPRLTCPTSAWSTAVSVVSESDRQIVVLPLLTVVLSRRKRKADGQNRGGRETGAEKWPRTVSFIRISLVVHFKKILIHYLNFVAVTYLKFPNSLQMSHPSNHCSRTVCLLMAQFYELRKGAAAATYRAFHNLCLIGMESPREVTFETQRHIFLDNNPQKCALEPWPYFNPHRFWSGQNPSHVVVFFVNRFTWDLKY